MVGFHNAAYGTAVTNWWSNGGSQIAFGRGSSAYAVFNRDGGTLSRTFATSLPAGSYCDVANGDYSGGACTGATYTVSATGTFTASLPANSMLALHVNARTSGSSCSSVAVTFDVNATTVWGENVYVLGNQTALSNWNASGGVALSSATYPVWRGTVSLPPNTTIEYKYVKKNGSAVLWESGANRTLTTGSACTSSVSDTWRP
jgi:alpha-amylase